MISFFPPFPLLILIMVMIQSALVAKEAFIKILIKMNFIVALLWDSNFIIDL